MVPAKIIANCPDDSFRQGLLGLANRLVATNRTTPLAYQWRSRVHRALGEEAWAIEDAEEAFRLEPNAHYANHLAWALVVTPDLSLRDPKRAVQLVQKALEAAPTNSSYWNTLGVAHYRIGRWKDAAEALEKSMELNNGGSGFDWYFLAMTRWQLGEMDAARKWYDRAVAWANERQWDSLEIDCFHTEATALLKVVENGSTKAFKQP